MSVFVEGLLVLAVDFVHMPHMNGHPLMMLSLRIGSKHRSGPSRAHAAISTAAEHAAGWVVSVSVVAVLVVIMDVFLVVDGAWHVPHNTKHMLRTIFENAGSSVLAPSQSSLFNSKQPTFSRRPLQVPTVEVDVEVCVVVVVVAVAVVVVVAVVTVVAVVAVVDVAVAVVTVFVVIVCVVVDVDDVDSVDVETVVAVVFVVVVVAVNVVVETVLVLVKVVVTQVPHRVGHVFSSSLRTAKSGVLQNAGGKAQILIGSALPLHKPDAAVLDVIVNVDEDEEVVEEVVDVDVGCSVADGHKSHIAMHSLRTIAENSGMADVFSWQSLVDNSKQPTLSRTPLQLATVEEVVIDVVVLETISQPHMLGQCFATYLPRYVPFPQCISNSELHALASRPHGLSGFVTVPVVELLVVLVSVPVGSRRSWLYLCQ